MKHGKSGGLGSGGGTSLRIYFDGASGPNPGSIRTNVHIAGRNYPMRAGRGTAPRAIWTAVALAVLRARKQGVRRVTLVGDNKMVLWHVARARSRHNAPISRLIGICENQFRHHFDQVEVELVDPHFNLARKELGRERRRAVPRATINHRWHQA